MQEQSFTPDADYCVELVLRLTSRRAVCTSCLAAAPPPPRRWPWAVAIALAALAAWALWR